MSDFPMLIDINPQVPDDFLKFDVCIVGSGPAGITLAREISRAGLRVCLLESGGHNPAAKIQDLNAGAVDSTHGYREEPLWEGRRRQFGGTANSGIIGSAVNPPGTFVTCPWMKSTLSNATGCRKAAGLLADGTLKLSTSAPSRSAASRNSTIDLGLWKSGRKTTGPGNRKKSSRSYPNLAYRGFFWSIIAENSFVISG